MIDWVLVFWMLFLTCVHVMIKYFKVSSSSTEYIFEMYNKDYAVAESKKDWKQCCIIINTSILYFAGVLR